MKITMFIGGFAPGGAERVFTDLCNYLCKNHQVIAMTWSDAKPYYKFDKKVTWVTLKKKWGCGRLNDYLLRYKNLRQYILKDNSDVYLAFLPLATYCLLSMKKIIKAPVLFSVRCLPEEEYKPFYMQLLARKYIPKADGIVFQTEQQKEYFNYIKIKSFEVIPNALSETFFKQKVLNVEKQKRIISVGRLSRQKNFPLLIAAFAKISKGFPEYYLVIFGEGEEREKLTKLAEKNGLKDKVFLPGNKKNIKQELIDSEIFVMSSDYEGISNALLEALSVGLPVVATDCSGGGARLLIQDKENGLLIPKQDKEKLAEGLRRLLEDESLRRKLSENAKKVNEAYAPDVILRRWEDYIRKIISEN